MAGHGHTGRLLQFHYGLRDARPNKIQLAMGSPDGNLCACEAIIVWRAGCGLDCVIEARERKRVGEGLFYSDL
jgi:hypothetical protein